MKKCIFERSGSRILNLQDQTCIDYKSINKAKKESIKIQLSEDGKLGLGSVQVVK
jgi:hypothetical protein